jgi:BTB/POZ domain
MGLKFWDIKLASLSTFDAANFLKSHNNFVDLLFRTDFGPAPHRRAVDAALLDAGAQQCPRTAARERHRPTAAGLSAGVARRLLGAVCRRVPSPFVHHFPIQQGTDIGSFPAHNKLSDPDCFQKEGTTLLLADIFSTCYGWENVKEIREQAMMSPGGARIDPQFVNNEELSDVRFRVEGRLFYAHKIVLITASPRFKSMLSSKFCEGSPPVVQINDIRYNIFQVRVCF